MLKSDFLSSSAIQLQPGRLRAATLVRVSTAEQAAEGKSGLERQRQANAAVVAAAGYHVVESIEITDVSGANSFSSPEMLHLLSLVERRIVDVVVVSEITRIFRPDQWTSFAYLDVFKRNGVLLNCGGSIYDLDSPEGFLSSGIMSLMGGFDRLQMKRRLQQAREALRASGYCPGSEITLPTGLRYLRKQRQFIYTPEIAQVQEAFRIFDEEGVRNISEVGRRVGIHHRTLKNLLSNPYVIGIRAYTMMRDQSRSVMKPGGRQADRPKIARRPEQVIRVRIFPSEEQAVSDERFERVQTFLKEIEARHQRYVAPHKGTNILSSVGWCGFCGERLYTASGKKKLADGTGTRGHYMCKSHHYLNKGRIPRCSQGWMRFEQMEDLVSAFVIRFLEDKEFVTAILGQAKAKQRETIVGIESAPTLLRQRLSDLEKRDRRLLDAVEAGAISLHEVKQRRQRLDEEKRTLLASLRDAESSPGAEDLPGGVMSRIASLGSAAWTQVECPRERKKLLSTLFLEIFVKGESLTAFKLAPSLVGSDSGDWSWVADIPVTLPDPFRVTPLKEPVALPDGHRYCGRCETVLPAVDFYGNRPGCRSCVKAANNARYAAKTAARRAGA